MTQRSAIVDPEVRARCRALNNEVIHLIGTVVLGDDNNEVVRDAAGNIIQRGRDLPGLKDPENSRLAFDTYTQPGPDEPVGEYVSVWRDHTNSKTGYLAFEAGFLEDGSTGRRGGSSEGLDGEIRWDGAVTYEFSESEASAYLKFMQAIVASLET